MYLCVYVMCTYVCEGQKKKADSLEWELEEAESYLVWGLETKLRASGRAASVILTTGPPLYSYTFLFYSTRDWT